MTEAGRDLDIAVAKLMGLKEPDDFGVVERHDWRWDEDDEYNTYVCHRCRLNSKDWMIGKESELEPGPCDLTPWLPHYSTSIAAAWEVIAYLMRTLNGPIFVLAGNNHMWESGFGHWLPDEVWIAQDSRRALRTGETASEAICRAALAAVAPET